MKCVMSRGVYLRADGRLPCYCGAGETVTLGRVPINGHPFDFMRDNYMKGLFNRIRESQSAGLVAFPGICDQCTYLDLDNQIEAELIDSELDWFHWEPSSLCMLDCQWCNVDKRKYKNSGQNRLLPLEVFERIVSDMARSGLRLNKGNICGVGEPTINPAVWEMVRLVRDKLGGDILMSTNGNGPYSENIVPAGLDKIKIAVDAVSQEVYERYRKNGSLQKAIDFTRAIANEKEHLKTEKPSIIWQYILFNYNDSDEDLITYQKMAADNGVNQLRIVYTRCTNYSTRSPDGNSDRYERDISDPNARRRSHRLRYDIGTTRVFAQSRKVVEAACERDWRARSIVLPPGSTDPALQSGCQYFKADMRSSDGVESHCGISAIYIIGVADGFER